MLKLMIGPTLLLIAAAVAAQTRTPQELATNQTAEDNRSLGADRRQLALIESLLGQVAKTVVYGGASFARFNNRLLCPLLSHETERDNEDQPTLFIFNNQLKREQAFRVYADDDITKSLIEEAQFDSNQMTLIFVHGWLGGIHNEMWLSDAKDAALKAGSRMSSDSKSHFRANVIVVEWSDFADGSLYSATKNSFKVSRRLARLLKQLAEVGGLKPELMHCFGHSIGAHICGQAARGAFPPSPDFVGKSRSSNGNSNKRLSLRQSMGEMRRFGRITGLDPGGFCYELGIKNETTYLGLKPSDALLVDALYTNRSPFGNRYQVTQYNVRVNNGFFQRPCSVWRNPDVASEYFRAATRLLLGNAGHNDILTCDHYFATRLAYQLPPPYCSYVGYACDSYRNFLRGRCGLCEHPGRQCYMMDFEYQRAEPSVEHALEQIANHSSYFNEGAFAFLEPDEGVVQPPGGVTYANRPVFYMRVGDDEPHCTPTFRVRVKLNAKAVDLRAFEADWIKLQFLGRQQREDDKRDSTTATQVLKVKDSFNSGKTVDTLSLHGPWRLSDGPELSHSQRLDAQQQFGIDEATLTALFELPLDQIPVNHNDEPLISDVLVIYDNQFATHQELLENPIESIKLDYLSSTDQRIRTSNSRTFKQQQLSVRYRHLVVADGSQK